MKINSRVYLKEFKVWGHIEGIDTVSPFPYKVRYNVKGRSTSNIFCLSEFGNVIVLN
jgi:hypothetical protein